MAFRLAHSQLAFQLTPALRNIIPTPHLNAKTGLMGCDVVGTGCFIRVGGNKLSTYYKKEPKFTGVPKQNHNQGLLYRFIPSKAKTCSESISSSFTIKYTSHFLTKSQY